MPELIPLIDEGKITINQAYQESKRKEIYDNSISTRKRSKSIPKDDDDTFKIYHKSSESMDEVEDASIDMIMCSPPYWKKISAGRKKEIGSEKTIEKYLDNLMIIFDECRRVLKSTGSMFIVIGDSYSDQCLASIPHRLAIRLTDEGWIQRNCIIWEKKNPSPENVTNRFSCSYEFIFFFTKNKRYQFYMDDVRQPYKWDKLDDVRPHYHQSRSGRIHVPTPKFQHPNGKPPQDIIEAAKQSTAIGKGLGLKHVEHGSVYPERICELPILATSKEGGVVLDPFSGSGTTGAVAIRFGRKFIGYEINKQFVQLSRRRLTQVVAELSGK